MLIIKKNNLIIIRKILHKLCKLIFWMIKKYIYKNFEKY